MTDPSISMVDVFFVIVWLLDTLRVFVSDSLVKPFNQY